MKCRDALRHLSPYIDSELDATRTYDISRHLIACPTCSKRFEEEETLERAIAERLRGPGGDESGMLERALSDAVSPRRRPGLLRVAVIAAGVALLGLLAYRLTTGGTEPIPELVEMVAKDHQRYLLGELRPELLTMDPAAVHSFFQGRVDGEMGAFPSGDGWQLEGARVCRFHEQPVGLVTLRYHGIPISVVDVPAASDGAARLTAADRCFELEGGRGILRRTRAGFRAAFGAVEMAKLEEIIAAAL
ncbi:MAG: hypothetical protein E2O39_07800 [Planctomycetota bacterium]|nr:MAG: hypothetical protein E2O39_07800 [Planctomycetota bacterium]